LVNRDISARKAADAQARRHQEQIAHANRLAAAGELASNIAHELNQPLGAIANYTSGALLKCQQQPTPLASELRLPLERIDEQVQRLAQRLRHLRSFVRKRSHRVRPLVLSEVVASACRLCEWQYQQASIGLVVHLPKALPRIYGDAIALEQVIVNLLLNALAASRRVDDAKTVRLSAQRSGQRQLTLSVKDEGPGVDPALQPMIFDAFFTTRDEGLGMGLAISRTLVESMGGALALRSDSAQGACFDICLRAETDA
jgi:two-component system sensor kinase FixL